MLSKDGFRPVKILNQEGCQGVIADLSPIELWDVLTGKMDRKARDRWCF
jgi:hypothetical protein